MQKRIIITASACCYDLRGAMSRLTNVKCCFRALRLKKPEGTTPHLEMVVSGSIYPEGE